MVLIQCFHSFPIHFNIFSHIHYYDTLLELFLWSTLNWKYLAKTFFYIWSFTVLISQFSTGMAVSLGNIFQSISRFWPRSSVARGLFSISSSVSSWPWWFGDFNSFFVRLHLMQHQMDIPLRPCRDIWAARSPVCNIWRVLSIILYLICCSCCAIRHSGVSIVLCSWSPITMTLELVISKPNESARLSKISTGPWIFHISKYN